mmetsp:Transcript_2746/g.7524  ORF Transcript_2746/g.7524 Transcript_2746/m.7524 type:complete len:240 (+) Transcript_2746:1008-1727(+)
MNAGAASAGKVRSSGAADAMAAALLLNDLPSCGNAFRAAVNGASEEVGWGAQRLRGVCVVQQGAAHCESATRINTDHTQLLVRALRKNAQRVAEREKQRAAKERAVREAEQSPNPHQAQKRSAAAAALDSGDSPKPKRQRDESGPVNQKGRITGASATANGAKSQDDEENAQARIARALEFARTKSPTGAVNPIFCSTWTTAQLREFCRAAGLSMRGAKPELQRTVYLFLAAHHGRSQT